MRFGYTTLDLNHWKVHLVNIKNYFFFARIERKKLKKTK